MTDASAQRYRQARKIALEVLDTAPQDRAARLSALCGEDAALYQEAEWLIQAAEDDSRDEVPEDFQTAARSALQQVSFEIPLPRNYRLIQRIGQGGTGIVYLAERVDGDLHQPVAFKLLHFNETDNEALLRRFSAERAILARLNHPHIAHLLDGGLTADGRPFLAMEFVDGERVDRWAAGPVSRAQILQLFLRVCEAVDHAHRHMIIHRDLKPANLLVTEDDEPKLLDFGVAALLDEGRPESDALPDLMTLAYASPEQILGQDLSAATDVYSLGVLLQELLSGQPAFDAGDEDPSALRQRVLRGQRQPLRGRRGQALPRDLTAIIERAVATDAGQRYPSVRALMEDIERHLSHHPVRARGSGLAYRAWRFARRHHAGLLLGLAAVLILAAFLVNRERQLEQIAWERDRAEAVTEFMTGLLTGTDSLPARGGEIAVRDLLDLGAEQLRMAGADNPAALSQIYTLLAQSYNALGLGERALPLLEQAGRTLALQITPAQAAGLQAELGAAYDSAGQAAASIAADEQALALLEQAGAERSPEALAIRIRQLRNQVNIRMLRPEVAEEQLQVVLDELPLWPERADELRFEALAALAGARIARGDHAGALESARQARELAEASYAHNDPRRLKGRHVHATALMQSDPAAAVEMYRQLIVDHERLVGPGQRLANTIGNLGVALSRMDRLDESVEAFERAAAMIEGSAGSDHYLYRLSIMNLALLRLRQDRPAAADALVQKILPGLEERHQRVGGIESFYLASALEVQGSARVRDGRPEDAIRCFRQALDVLDEAAENGWADADLRGRIAERLAALQG